MYFSHLENVHYLVNSTLSSFAAVVRTDTDKTVVVSTLETLDEVLKPLKTMQFSVKDEVVSNLMTSIQDVMDNKVKGYHLHLSSPAFVIVYGGSMCPTYC